MPTSEISVTTDAKLKAKAVKALADLGLDMTTAINIFLQQLVDEKSLPFKVNQPTASSITLGGWEGQIEIAEDFDEPLEEFNEYM